MKLNHYIAMWLLMLAGCPVMAEEVPALQSQTLIERSVELSGAKLDVKVLRVTLAKGFKTPEHVHEGPGARYVIKGRVKISGAGQTDEYGPGQVFWESGQTMTAENISEGDAELLIFEVDPQKKPSE